MKKYILSLVLVIVLVLSAVGCASNNDTPVSPSQAETPEPKPEATPEPHIHVWVDANCQTPKTCSDCRETEGSALAHDLSEATFWEPSVCLVCGEIVGEVLTSFIIEIGLSTEIMSIGTEYPYRSVCYDDTSVETIGTVTITDYKAIESDEKREAKDGYVWHIVKIKYSFGDENANNYGMMFRSDIVNYFTGDYYGFRKGILNEENEEVFAVVYNDETFECLNRFESLNYNWSNTNSALEVFTEEVEHSILLPSGYESMVIFPINSKFNIYDGDNWELTGSLIDWIDEYSVFFKLN